MGEIVQEEKSQKGGKKRAKKHPAHVDMTPMVDLICLLLTFFILTAAFNKPKTMVINMPDKEKHNPPKVLDTRMLNILVGDSGKVYYYVGMIQSGKPDPELIKSNFSKDGIRKVLLEKNKDLFSKISTYKDGLLTGKIKDPDSVVQRKIREWKKSDADNNTTGGPTVLIKASEKTKYRDIVALVNEMSITNIAVYAIIDMNAKEKEMLAKAPK
jgi:biopolymer transport protein ExbD